ncbi:hypothetical protein [Tenacibaculum maritimum]|uniref:hypothetical protein n=1 Tax=Tenacibaculum maritimum TaxID=107401 RepID=UPI0003FC784F|nr:hypothetical protein [Tenacibaculum maritimum]
MKKRHEQKLIVLSILLFLLFNIPFIFIANTDEDIIGIPMLYFFIFSVWLLAIAISMIILNKYYE